MNKTRSRLCYAIFKLFSRIINRYISRYDYVPDEMLEKAVIYVSRFIKNEKTRQYMAKLLHLYKEKYSALYLHKKIIVNLNYNVRKRITDVLIKYLALPRPPSSIEKGGPIWMGISPTMKCNNNCKLCYANDYPQEPELSRETIISLFKQAQEMGIFVVCLTGGEPLMYEGLIEICSKFKGILFLLFTNGKLLDEKNIKKLALIGNIVPMLSIDGYRSLNDKFRGEGSFNTIMKTMDLLKKHGAAFGFSATANRENAQCILSDEFISLMEKKGALVGWITQYIPLGKFSDTGLVVTPEQRVEMFYRTYRLIKKYPIFLIDMWNYAWVVGGCTGAGKNYFHINNRGGVEPCNIVHFSVDSIYDKPLKEILSTGFFKEIRKNQPFRRNQMLSCLANENILMLKELIEQNNAKPSHPQAKYLLEEDLLEFFTQYSQKWEKLSNPIWEKIEKNRDAADWKVFLEKKNER